MSNFEGNVLPVKLDAWKCEECGRVYADKMTAEGCHGKWYCEDCGIEVPKYRIYCHDCGDKHTFEKAEHLKEWSGPVYCPDFEDHNEGFFENVGDLLEWCDDLGIDPPEWVFCCTSWPLHLDAGYIVDNLTEDAYEDAVDDLVAVDELTRFIDEWNAKQTAACWEPDYKKILLIREGGEKGA